MATPNDKTMTVEEKKTVDSLHRQARELVQAIGQAEVHKAKLMSQLAGVEEKAHDTLEAIRLRLGIPAGTPWYVGTDGSIVTETPPSPTPGQ